MNPLFRQSATTPRCPLDHPVPERPHRVYLTLTNHCNRECPWCGVFASPRGATWLSREQLRAALPGSGPFEVQLEGGEPTLHPLFWEYVARLRREERCRNLVLATNGTTLPREGVMEWLARFGPRFTLKLSLNHALLERDHRLWEKAVVVREALAGLGGERRLVLNARFRPGSGDESWLQRELAHHGLEGVANLFPLQRQGRAAVEAAWPSPFLVGWNFSLINPDGRNFGQDLAARAAAMERLP